MRKATLLMLPVLAIMAASCSDDDDNAQDYATKVKGNYEGYALASCAYFENNIAASEKLNIAAATPDKATVSYKSDSWGQFTVEEATVAETGGAYTISGSGTTVMGMNGNTQTYECTLSGTVAGGAADLTFTVPAVMGGLKVRFVSGDIPASVVVPATYSGYTKADCAYFQDMYADDQSIVISAEGDGAYKAVLVSDTWGEFTVTDITATAASGSFTLEGNGICKMGMGGNLNEYECSFAGSVADDRSQAEFTFTVPAVMGGMTLTFRTGTRTDA